MSPRQTALSERMRRLGYARNNQVKLYGRVFELLSDPICLGENLMFVDAWDLTSHMKTRIRIPMTALRLTD